MTKLVGSAITRAQFYASTCPTSAFRHDGKGEVVTVLAKIVDNILISGKLTWVD